MLRKVDEAQQHHSCCIRRRRPRSRLGVKVSQRLAADRAGLDLVDRCLLHGRNLPAAGKRDFRCWLLGSPCLAQRAAHIRFHLALHPKVKFEAAKGSGEKGWVYF